MNTPSRELSQELLLDNKNLQSSNQNLNQSTKFKTSINCEGDDVDEKTYTQIIDDQHSNDEFALSKIRQRGESLDSQEDRPQNLLFATEKAIESSKEPIKITWRNVNFNVTVTHTATE